MTIVIDQEALDTAAYFRGYMAEGRRQAEEASGRTSCDACGHVRKHHSRLGCMYSDPGGPQCTCTVTYMDL